MKWTFLLTVALLFTDLDKISKINTLKSEAKKAYQSGDYKTAIEKYQYLKDSLGVNEEEVLMNLANAYYQANDSVNASYHYRNLSQSATPKLRSIANQQMGILENRQGKLEESLSYFKQALKADPTNEEARFNYEMVKKKLEEKKKQEEQQKQNQDQKKDQKDQKDEQKQDQKDKEQKDKDKKDQEKKDQQDQQKKDQRDQKDQKEQDKQSKEEKEQQEKEKQQQEQEQKEKEAKEKDKVPPSVSEKLKQMEMSEEKAKMILEAMKNQEIQYLQQNKRKASKPKDRGKPDW